MSLLALIFQIIQIVLSLAITVLIIYVVLSWLFAFDIVSRRNALVYSIYDFASRLSDPMVRPFRRFIPPINGVDLSVLVLTLVLILLRGPVLAFLYQVLTGGPWLY